MNNKIAYQKIINAAKYTQESSLHAMKYRAMKLDAFMSEMGAKGQHAEQLKKDLKVQIDICIGTDKLQN